MTAFPNPVFEGSEKRLEIDFYGSSSIGGRGLRALSRQQLDFMLSQVNATKWVGRPSKVWGLLGQAACCVVSESHVADFDAYVLSESSLFVYSDKLVLKTCGTTLLLSAVPTILDHAAGLGLRPRRCKYSRASFLFPEQQPAPHHDFQAEVATLRKSFGHLGGGAYVLGDAANGLQWHVYVAEDSGVPAEHSAVYSLEICMTDLCRDKASQWYRCPKFVSARETTVASGIADLLSGAAIDDYLFDPCGYSMNGLEGSAFSTIHVTPEDGFSYASVELTGYKLGTLDRDHIAAKVLEIFKPRRAVVALSVDKDVDCCPWSSIHLEIPEGYTVLAGVAQNFGGLGRTAFISLGLEDVRCGKGMGDGGLESPRGVVPDGENRGCPFSDHSSTLESDGDSVAETAGIPPSVLQAELARLVQKSAISDGSACFSADKGVYGKAVAERLPVLPMTVPEVLETFNALPLPAATDAIIDVTFAELIQQNQLEDPVYIVDLGMVRQLYSAWLRMMPRVHPHYAVKCFPDRGVLAMLAACGAGFDCASDDEASLVLSLGVSADRIVLANCCKRPRDMRYAAQMGIQYTTFDTVCELQKLAKYHPMCQALLRLRTDDVTARCQLGNKYGANPADAAALLQVAKELGIAIVGVSFHVGSGASNPAAFSEAIKTARDAFEEGLALGLPMSILDIGGGFSGGTFDSNGAVQLGKVPEAVNAALDKYFPEICGVHIIAEPGRYFAEACAHLACLIFGVRPGVGLDGTPTCDYWITDGLYGSMNCLLYDHAVLQVRVLDVQNPLGKQVQMKEKLPSTVFGPTCDGLDVVLRDYPLPKVDVGGWLIFPHMGAYTLCGAANFNGIHACSPHIFYVDSGC